MNEMVSIPVSEYRRLLAAAEALSDLAAYDAAKARLAAGEDELLPAAFADRLLDGESPLRVWREARGLTQAGLAQASGVNRVQIAEMETGRKSGSVATLQKLAAALRLAVDDLI